MALCPPLAENQLSGLGHRCGNVSLPHGNSQAQGAFLQGPESHHKATHKPTASVLHARYYGILNLRYRSNALAPGQLCSVRQMLWGLNGVNGEDGNVGRFGKCGGLGASPDQKRKLRPWDLLIKRVPLTLSRSFLTPQLSGLLTFESCNDFFGGGVAHLVELDEFEHPFVGSAAQAEL